MSRFKKISLLVLILSLSSTDSKAAEIPLVINELMASNSSCIQDPQGQYDDWIEIHNYGNEAIDIGGMYLTDDFSVPTKWRIPADNRISSGGFLLIWADDDTADTGLHASFKLDADGEELALFDSDGVTLIDRIIFSDQTTDISYGRYPDAGDARRFFRTPSPAARNLDAYLGVVEAPRFSHERGFYNELLFVTLATETEGATIYYTLNGSRPFDTSKGRGRPLGRVYTGPIRIATTTCLRAEAIKPGYKPHDVVTHTYIFPNDVLLQSAAPSGFPSTWGSDNGSSIPADYQMDPDIVRHPLYRRTMKDALLTHRTLSLVLDLDDLFAPATGIYSNSRREGAAWERPVSVEFIDPYGGPELHVNAGLRIQGGASRNPNRPKHNLRLLFKGIYGPTKLEFPVFENWPVVRFDTLILRGGNGDSWFHPSTIQQIRAQYIRDQWPRDTQHDMGRIACGQGYVHLYINGLYWGLYHTIERPNASFFAEHLGGSKDDYDVVQHKGGTVDGDRQAWNAMMRIVNGELARNEAVEEIEQYLDIDNLIDFLLVNFFMGNVDWDHNNWYGGRKREPGAGFRFFTWDSERTFLRLNDNVTGKNNANQPTHVHQQLSINAEYRMRFADHVHKHFFNGGTLTPESTAARWMRRADEIALALWAESARWGDNKRPNDPYTPEAEWRAELNFLITEYFPQRADIVLNQLKARNLYPNLDAPVFNINGSYQHGGLIGAQDRLSMTAPMGTIWYTLDGNDPRVPGTPRSIAGISPKAIRYVGPITLLRSVHAKARVLRGRAWSALNEAVFAVGPVTENLHISEIMYHPLARTDAGEPNEEFIELTNVGTETIDLNLVRFTNGIDFTFPSFDLAPGHYIVVVQDLDVFEARYGANIPVAGQYTGRLNNAGERITLVDAIGQTILDVSYRDGWRSLTDGEGFSLTIIDPANPDLNRWDDKNAWRASSYIGGSPGRDDSGILPNPGDVVINELLANSPGGDPDWIELYNTTGTAMDLGGWFLSDRNDNIFKYEIAPGTTIGPFEYLVFYEDIHFSNTNDVGCHDPFALSDNGESIILSSAQDGVLTGYREVEDFGASADGVSFGRYDKFSTGNTHFVAMEIPTPGSENAYPKVGPIVISEIMYNPDWPDGGAYMNDQYEYIELHNIGAEPVTLYDFDTEAPWAFTRGIDFTFPTDFPVTISAGGYLLVVKHPEAFMWRYPSVPVEMIFGPYDGKLSNAGESVELSRPGDVDKDGKIYYIRIDRVNYSDGLHPEACPDFVDLWPTGPDGSSLSLTRKIPAEYGNDPDNWIADAPSPAE